MDELIRMPALGGRIRELEGRTVRWETRSGNVVQPEGRLFHGDVYRMEHTPSQWSAVLSPVAMVDLLRREPNAIVRVNIPVRNHTGVWAIRRHKLLLASLYVRVMD